MMFLSDILLVFVFFTASDLLRTSSASFLNEFEHINYNYERHIIKPRLNNLIHMDKIKKYAKKRVYMKDKTYNNYESESPNIERFSNIINRDAENNHEQRIPQRENKNEQVYGNNTVKSLNKRLDKLRDIINEFYGLIFTNTTEVATDKVNESKYVVKKKYIFPGSKPGKEKTVVNNRSNKTNESKTKEIEETSTFLYEPDLMTKNTLDTSIPKLQKQISKKYLTHKSEHTNVTTYLAQDYELVNLYPKSNITNESLQFSMRRDKQNKTNDRYNNSKPYQKQKTSSLLYDPDQTNVKRLATSMHVLREQSSEKYLPKKSRHISTVNTHFVKESAKSQKPDGETSINKFEEVPEKSWPNISQHLNVEKTYLAQDYTTLHIANTTNDSRWSSIHREEQNITNNKTNDSQIDHMQNTNSLLYELNQTHVKSWATSIQKSKEQVSEKYLPSKSEHLNIENTHLVKDNVKLQEANGETSIPKLEEAESKKYLSNRSENMNIENTHLVRDDVKLQEANGETPIQKLEEAESKKYLSNKSEHMNIENIYLIKDNVKLQEPNAETSIPKLEEVKSKKYLSNRSENMNIENTYLIKDNVKLQEANSETSIPKLEEAESKKNLSNISENINIENTYLVRDLVKLQEANSETSIPKLEEAESKKNLSNKSEHINIENTYLVQNHTKLQKANGKPSLQKLEKKESEKYFLKQSADINDENSYPAQGNVKLQNINTTNDPILLNREKKNITNNNNN